MRPDKIKSNVKRRRNMKKILCLTTAIVLASSLCACGGGAATTTTKAAAATTKAAAAATTKAAAATTKAAAGATTKAAAGATTKAAASTGTASGDMVMYSTMTENDLNVMLDCLKKKFPKLNIEVVNGTAGELTARIGAEKDNPQGDMMWGGLADADGTKYTDLFEHWLSDYESQQQEQYKSPNGFYSMDHLSTVALCVNTNLEKELGLDIKGYAELTNEKLKGKILLADPTSSSSAWNNVSNIMSVYGNDSDASWKYIESLLKNGLVIAASSSACFKSVESGEYVVGLTYEDGIAALLKSGAKNIKLVYPAEGTSASAFGTSVIKGAKNAANAKAVINYIMSPEGQKDFGEANGTIRMTTAQTINSKYLPATNSIKWVKRDTKWLTDNRQKVVDHWTQLYTSTKK